MASLVCKILGPVFIAIGVVGFFTGHHLLMFGISGAHNIVHLASGAVALWAGFSSPKYAKTYCILFGLVYAAVTALGFINYPLAVSLLNLNQADNFLHLAIAAVCLGAGFTTKAGVKV